MHPLLFPFILYFTFLDPRVRTQCDRFLSVHYSYAWLGLYSVFYCQLDHPFTILKGQISRLLPHLLFKILVKSFTLVLLKFGTFKQSFIYFNEQTVQWNGSELAREAVSNVTDKCTTLDMHRSLPFFLDGNTALSKTHTVRKVERHFALIFNGSKCFLVCKLVW